MDEDKTREQLIAETQDLRRRVVELEREMAECRRSPALIPEREQRQDPVIRASGPPCTNEFIEEQIAERRKVEAQLRQSEEEFRRIIDNLHDAFYRTDMTGKITFLSPASERVAGYRPEEAVGRNIAEFYANPEERQEFMRLMMANGFVNGFEARLVRKDGGIVWVSTSARFYKDRHGTIAGVEGISRDVTNRKNMENSLRHSEARYRELFENSSDILYTCDLDGNYTSVNAAAIKATGYTAEECLSSNFRDIVHPDHLPAAEEYLRKKRENGWDKTGPYEVRIRSKDGTPRWFDVTSRVIRDGEKPVGVHGTARDVTDRKRAQEALRESEEKYRVVVEHANEGICVVQDGVVRFLNPKALEILGHAEHELTSRPLSEFVHPDDRRAPEKRNVTEADEYVFSGTRSFRVTDALGHTKWVEANSVAITWDGRPAGLNFIVDITARRRMEEELVKVEKLESLGILAGGIAHDFNNILTAIMGNISLAKMHIRLPEKATERIIEAEKGCRQAQSLTQQLLTFSRGGAPRKKTTSLSQLIADCCTLAVRGSNSLCELSIAEDLRAVEVDEGQIGQVLNNLIINADQSMPDGGVIHVRAANVAVTQENGLPLRDGTYARLTISDRGEGIPVAVLPRIFDPYFTTKPKGSGLGLATAFSIVRNHDGFITADSEPGGGTTFSVYLPVAAKEIPLPIDPEDSVPVGSGKVLVMDDEAAIRDLASQILACLGYEVVVAEDGTGAINRYRVARAISRPFDVVILDLTVPGGMSGLETLQKLREIDPYVTAIVSSGYSNDPIMSDYRTYGFCGVVAKPYTPKELATAMKDVIAGRQRSSVARFA